MHRHYRHNLNHAPKSIRDKLGLNIGQFYGLLNQTTSNFRINSKDLRFYFGSNIHCKFLALYFILLRLNA